MPKIVARPLDNFVSRGTFALYSWHMEGKRGQPTKWRPEHNEALVKYFDIPPSKTVTRVKRVKGELVEVEEIVAAEFPTLEGFAASIDVDVDCMSNWANADRDAMENGEESKYPGFFGAYKKAKQLQKALLITNSMAGRYHPIFSIFVAKNVTDMRDKQELEHTGKDGSPLFLPTSIVNKNNLTNEESSRLPPSAG